MLGIKPSVPSLNQILNVAITMLVVYFVVRTIVPAQYRKYFTV